MKHRIKNTLRGMAQHLGIKIKFVDYLSDDVHGKLLPREKRILINAHKPRVEHMFTVLHEIGHFLVQFKNPLKHCRPWFLNIEWKQNRLARLQSQIRRSYRFWLNSNAGTEWQADLWAMCAFVYLSRVIGCRRELFAFLNRHPEKTGVFLLAAYGSKYARMKSSLAGIIQRTAKHLQLLRRSVVP